jgi:hypothetical protein
VSDIIEVNLLPVLMDALCDAIDDQCMSEDAEGARSHEPTASAARVTGRRLVRLSAAEPLPKGRGRAKGYSWVGWTRSVGQKRLRAKARSVTEMRRPMRCLEAGTSWVKAMLVA